MYKGIQFYMTPLLYFELTQAHIVRLFFFSHSLDCISCGRKEMCDTPIGTTSWSPAKKRNGFEEDDLSGAQ